MHSCISHWLSPCLPEVHLLQPKVVDTLHFGGTANCDAEERLLVKYNLHTWVSAPQASEMDLKGSCWKVVPISDHKPAGNSYVFEKPSANQSFTNFSKTRKILSWQCASLVSRFLDFTISAHKLHQFLDFTKNHLLWTSSIVRPW